MDGARLIRVAACAVAIALSSGSAHADTPRREKISRAEVLERLKRENLSLVAAKYRLSQARAEVVAAGVWQNPNVSASVLTFTHGVVTGGQTELTFGVDQVLPIGGQVGLRKDVAKGYLTTEERAYASTLWQLVSDAKLAYLELQRSEARARVARAAHADLAKVEGIVTERANAGAISPYDRVRVGAERSKLESRIAQADVDAVTARAGLAETVGKSVDARTVSADETLEDPPEPTRDVDALVRRAVASRPEIAGARARAEAAELRVEYLRRMYFPSPDLSAAYTRYLAVPNQVPSAGGALTFGISLPVPLFDHGQGTVDRGLALAAEDRANRDAVELGIRRDVEKAAQSAQIRVETWHRFRDVAAADIVRLRTIAELSYKEGRATILELLDAYATFLDSEERGIDLRAAAVKATLDLERSVGPQ